MHVVSYEKTIGLAEVAAHPLQVLIGVVVCMKPDDSLSPVPLLMNGRESHAFHLQQMKI